MLKQYWIITLLIIETTGVTKINSVASFPWQAPLSFSNFVVMTLHVCTEYFMHDAIIHVHKITEIRRGGALERG